MNACKSRYLHIYIYCLVNIFCYIYILNVFLSWLMLVCTCVGVFCDCFSHHVMQI